MKSSRTETYIYKSREARWQAEERQLVLEIPLKIWVNGDPLTTLHRTPGNDLKLAAGYLYYQGLIGEADEITAHRLVTADREKGSPLAGDSMRLTIRENKNAVSSLTASAIWTIIAGQTRKSQAAPFFLAPDLVTGLPDKLHEQQQLFQSTAGAHAVALVNRAGKILHCEEDVGRTNALDKLMGYCLLEKIDMTSLGAMFSGRINLEMAVKICRAGFPLVLSISAPTAGAVAILKEAGINYVGSLRSHSFALFNGSL